jgi:hypothetical protein
MMESLSFSLVEQTSESLTLSVSQVILGVSTVIEASHMVEAETVIESVIYLDNSETLVTQIATRTMLPTITWIYSNIICESVVTMSSVVLSLTFMVVQMPVYVTVMSQFDLVLEKQTGIVSQAISHASLIAIISSAAIIVLAFIVVILWFVRQQQKGESLWEDDSNDFNSAVSGRATFSHSGGSQTKPSETEMDIEPLNEPEMSSAISSNEPPEQENNLSGDLFMIDGDEFMQF